MRKRPVGFRHLVGILALFDGAAGLVERIHDLAGKALSHGLFTAVARVCRQPAQTERLPPLRADLHRDLIGRAADTAGP